MEIIDREERGSARCTSCVRRREQRDAASHGSPAFYRTQNTIRPTCSLKSSWDSDSDSGILISDFSRQNNVLRRHKRLHQDMTSCTSHARHVTCVSRDARAYIPRLVLLTLLMFLVQTDVCSGFNLDTSAPITLSIPAGQTDSYFGYTVAMFRNAAGVYW